MGQVYKARDTRLNRYVAIKFLHRPRSPPEPQEPIHPGGTRCFGAGSPQHHHRGPRNRYSRRYRLHRDGARHGKDAGLIDRASRICAPMRPSGSPAQNRWRSCRRARRRNHPPRPQTVQRDGEGDADRSSCSTSALRSCWMTNRLKAKDRAQPVETLEGAILGTVASCPPGNRGRALDVRSDIFSFGSVLYEMVTGRHPFLRDSAMAALSAILKEERKPPAGVPCELERIIRRCLRKDPPRRFRPMTTCAWSSTSSARILNAAASLCRPRGPPTDVTAEGLGGGPP